MAKRPGGHLREFFGEWQDEDGVEAGRGEQIEFFGERGDEGKGGFGAQDAGGMGFEGDGDGFCAESAGTGDDLFDDRKVTAMDAIEVADGGDGGAEVRPGFGEMAKYLHQAISKFIFWPS